MWLTFATSRLAVRLPVSLAIVLLIVFSWFIGLAIIDERPGIEIFLITTGFCYLLFALLVLPLWIGQRVSQRRITLWYEPVPMSSKEQFSVRYILIATAGVAGLVTLGQLIFMGESWSGDLTITGRALVGISTMVFWLAAYVLTLVWSLMWMILVEESRKLGWLLAIVAALTFSPFIVSECLFRLVGRAPPDLYPWVIAGRCLFGVAMLIVTVISLAIAHSWGFRLIGTENGSAVKSQKANSK